MKSKVASMLSIAASVWACGVRATEMPGLDSSQFEFRYEMEVLPMTQDLDGDGLDDFMMNNAANNWLKTQDGYVEFACTNVNNYIGSNSANTDAPKGVWYKYGVTRETGFTIETRLRIRGDSGTSAAFCLQASIPDSNIHAFLNFKAQSLLWGTTVITNMNTAATFHTYRIARAADTDVYSVWCDGILVKDNLGAGLTYGTLNRLLFGSIGGGYKGIANVAYLRFTKGGYAPQRTVMDSSAFAHKYEMDSTDVRFSPTETATDWTLADGKEGTAMLDSGLLKVVQPNGKMRSWKTVGKMDESITTSSPFTFELKARIADSWDTAKPVVNLLVGTPRASGAFFIGANGVSWYNPGNVIYSCDNTDRMHSFRIAYEGDTDFGFTFWRDGEKIGENLSCFDMKGAYSFVRFGIVSTSTHGGAFEVDYIRWTTDGVFAPYIPPKGTMFIFK